jgi:dTDP-4-dehydrorhamnose 3,5-epimerase-like enzyme
MVLEIFKDSRGSLIPIELNKIPFNPKRIFIVQNVPINTIRGNHAHYTTIQYLFCISGLIEVILNDGNIEKTFKIKEGEGVLIDNLIWDSQKFLTENSSILVLCSTEYDINDYIFDFNEFKKIT